MNLLNNQDLNRLNNAIRSAEQNMVSLAQQADAIAKGDQEAIKNIAFALRICEQTYNERLRQVKNEKVKALQES